jgi:hypothetical protein
MTPIADTTDRTDTLPCHCQMGHAFTRTEAVDLNYQCDTDGTAITCERTNDHNENGE